MVFAIMLVNTDIGEETKVLKSVRSLRAVDEANVLYGVYDPMVKMKTNSIDKLKDVIKLELRQITGTKALTTPKLLNDNFR